MIIVYLGMYAVSNNKICYCTLGSFFTNLWCVDSELVDKVWYVFFLSIVIQDIVWTYNICLPMVRGDDGTWRLYTNSILKIDF